MDSEEIKMFLIDKIKSIKVGKIGGIGFHPWVLFSDKNILAGFIEVLRYINNQNNIRVEKAIYFINQSAENN